MFKHVAQANDIVALARWQAFGEISDDDIEAGGLRGPRDISVGFDACSMHASAACGY